MGGGCCYTEELAGESGLVQSQSSDFECISSNCSFFMEGGVLGGTDGSLACTQNLGTNNLRMEMM